MSDVEEARTVEVRTQERGRESWAISLTTETSTGGYTDTIRMTEAEARAVYAALGERLSVPPSDDEREALEAIWDDGNAVGLDGWVGPGRGTEPVDEYAIQARARAIEKHAAALRRQGPITDEVVEAAKWAIAKERFRRAGISVLWVDRVDADLCEADARAALEAADRVRSAVPSTTEPTGQEKS